MILIRIELRAFINWHLFHVLLLLFLFNFMSVFSFISFFFTFFLLLFILCYRKVFFSVCRFASFFFFIVLFISFFIFSTICLSFSLHGSCVKTATKIDTQKSIWRNEDERLLWNCDKNKTIKKKRELAISKDMRCFQVFFFGKWEDHSFSCQVVFDVWTNLQLCYYRKLYDIEWVLPFRVSLENCLLVFFWKDFFLVKFVWPKIYLFNVMLNHAPWCPENDY